MASIRYLDEEENAAAIKAYREISETSIGPRGRLKNFKTSNSGYAMTTTTSSKIFNSLTAYKPIIQILLAGVKSHLQLHSDGGLFLASLLSSLYLTHVESKIPRQLCMRVNNYVCKEVMKFLDEDGFNCKLDIGKLDDMMVAVKSILASKPTCQLSLQEIDHLSIIILKAFYNSLSGSSSDTGFLIVPCEGPSTMQSHLVSGILIQIQQTERQMQTILTSMQGRIKLVICTVSLAGHQKEKTVISEEGKSSVKGMVFAEIFQICDAIIKAGGKLLLCQKVVHPSVRKYLKTNGVLVCDRLGIQSAKMICQKLDIVPIQSMFLEVSNSNYAEIENVKFMEFNGKRFIVLNSEMKNNHAYTVMLCACEENTLDELKHNVQAAEKMLFQLIRDPRILPGAGCFEAQIACIIRRAAPEVKNTETSLGNMATVQIHAAVDNIAKSFERIATSIQHDMGDCFTDTTFRHLWCFPKNTDINTVANSDYRCCCGCINIESRLQFQPVSSRSVNYHPSVPAELGSLSSRRLPDIVDSLFTKRESIAAAFELCDVILRIASTIQG